MSDHQLGAAPDAFVAATWNVFHGSTRSQLDPILSEISDRDTSVLLLQELSQDWGPDWLEHHGWRAWRFGRQYTVAWKGPQWRRLSTGGIRLSDTGYWARGGDGVQYSDAAWAVLADRRGRSLAALSYHLPSGIQVREEKRPENRYQAATESIHTLQELARDSVTAACLFGGDDNVDELHGIGHQDGTWAAWYDGPLTWHRAPQDTFGHRTIDDLATVGLRSPAGSGWTVGGTEAEHPSHRPYGRRFIWSPGR